MWDPNKVQSMRDELVTIGVKELKTPADVDNALSDKTGTAVVMVNSVCGCAAGGARPGFARALKHSKVPQKLFTVFAGQDKEATERARTYFTGQTPSSPAVALFKDGKLVHMVHRHNIEGHTPEEIAQQLTKAFDAYC